MTVALHIPAEVTGPEAPQNPEAGNPPASSSAPASANNQRPEWLPEKFNSPEDLAKAYSELESKLGSQSQQPTPAAPAVSEEQLGQDLQTKGLDINAFQQEYDANGGKLSEESYAKLAQAGYSREFVNDYIRGQEALAAQESEAIFKEVGGEAEFKKVAAWARANLPAHEVEAFNRIIESAPVDALRFAVLGLHSKYVAANGQEPRLVNGQPGANVEGFASRAQMVEAMRDPRYRKDEAYRAEVQQKLAVSDIF